MKIVDLIKRKLTIMSLNSVYGAKKNCKIKHLTCAECKYKPKCMIDEDGDSIPRCADCIFISNSSTEFPCENCKGVNYTTNCQFVKASR